MNQALVWDLQARTSAVPASAGGVWQCSVQYYKGAFCEQQLSASYILIGGNVVNVLHVVYVRQVASHVCRHLLHLLKGRPPCYQSALLESQAQLCCISYSSCAVGISEAC